MANRGARTGKDLDGEAAAIGRDAVDDRHHRDRTEIALVTEERLHGLLHDLRADGREHPAVLLLHEPFEIVRRQAGVAGDLEIVDRPAGHQAEDDRHAVRPVGREDLHRFEAADDDETPHAVTDGLERERRIPLQDDERPDFVGRWTPEDRQLDRRDGAADVRAEIVSRGLGREGDGDQRQPREEKRQPAHQKT